jgi:hypothetical protein
MRGRWPPHPFCSFLGYARPGEPTVKWPSSFLPAAASLVLAALPACAQMAEPAGERSLDSMVQAARSHASHGAGVAPGSFELVRAERVTWRDGSLGCPIEGRAFTQALVPGYRIALRMGEQSWDYHASRRGGLVLCPAGQAEDPLPNGRD